MKKEICALFLSLTAIAATAYLTKDAPSCRPSAGALGPCASPCQPGAVELPFLRMGPLFGSSNPLGLSDAQKENIDQITELFQSTAMPRLRRIDAAREAILALVRQERFDEEAAQAIASDLTNDINELLVDQEHLEAMVGAELGREQRERAERILRELDELLGASDVGMGAELSCMNAGIRDALSLSEAQNLQMEKILGSERAALRPVVLSGHGADRASKFPVFGGYFHETEARSDAQARAAKIAQLLVSTGRGMARLYGLLNEEQKRVFARREDELELLVRDSIPPRHSSPPAATVSIASPSSPLL